MNTFNARGRIDAPAAHDARTMAAGALALIKNGDNDAGFDLAELALKADADCAAAHCAAGIALRHFGALVTAEQAYRQALSLDPGNTLYEVNLASLLQDTDPANADIVPMLDRAMAGHPDWVYAQQVLQNALLSQGDLARGWDVFAARLKYKYVAAQVCTYDLPDWNGKPGQRVLVVSEEGPGERLMFAGAIPELIAAGVTPILECRDRFASMAPLFRRSFPGVEAYTSGEAVRADSKLIIGDVARLFRATFARFPNRKGYLKADFARVRDLRARLGDGVKVGIAWRSINDVCGRAKTIPLAMWKPVLDVPGATFVDLQYGDTLKERADFPQLVHLDDVNLTDDMDELAAATAACDVVISISTLTAHMAGALGVPCHTMLPAAVGRMWFWFLERADSPWYPSMILHRQHRHGDWTAPLAAVAQALRHLTQRAA